MTARRAPQSAPGRRPRPRRTDVPGGMSKLARACQSSPRTRIWPTGASAAVTSPIESDQVLDPRRHLDALHPALPVRDLDDAAREAEDPPTTFHGSGRMRQSSEGESDEHRPSDHSAAAVAGTSYPLWAMRAAAASRDDLLNTRHDQEAPMPEGPQPRRDAPPIPDRAPVGLTTYERDGPPDTHYPPIERLLPPRGCAQRARRAHRQHRLRRLERLRRAGATHRTSSGSPPRAWKYTRFHTTALCSPTRAALLSGRNHHTVGMGGITEIATRSARATTRCGPTTARRSPRR